jgi:hypothetical protein
VRRSCQCDCRSDATDGRLLDALITAAALMLSKRTSREATCEQGWQQDFARRRTCLRVPSDARGGLTFGGVCVCCVVCCAACVRVMERACGLPLSHRREKQAGGRNKSRTHRETQQTGRKHKMHSHGIHIGLAWSPPPCAFPGGS